MTLRTDLFSNPTKYQSNISNGFGVMLRKPIVDARPTAPPPPTPARPPARPSTFIILITSFQLEKSG